MRIWILTKSGAEKSFGDDRVIIGKNVYYNADTSTEIEPPFVAAVADGVGGAAGGADAACFVAKKLSEYPFNIPLNADSVRSELVRVNNALLKQAKVFPEKAGMATTLSGIISDGEAAFIFHVGNTRVYGVFGGYLKQLTGDHTTFEYLKMTGNDSAAQSCNKSEITACIGGGTPDYLSRLEVFSFDKFSELSRIVLTSDGVHDYADIDTLERLLTGELTDKTCRRIMEAALLKGSRDDISVVIIEK
ncbi:MAG: protein phosphatase 2C domain-containing protein [Oscillospiraceae bacterium]|jgi:protein phosphatase